MKREEILFYLAENKMYFFLLKLKKEVVKKVDTTSFFKFGEIYSVDECFNTINKIVSKFRIVNGIFKPIVHVLYNDVTNCDLEYLYANSLLSLNYSEIKFYKMTDLLKEFDNYNRIVFFNSGCYTFFAEKVKLKSLNKIGFNPIVIGDNDCEHIHFSDSDIIWNRFKSHFTKE